MKKVFGVLMMLALAFNIQAQDVNVVTETTKEVVEVVKDGVAAVDTSGLYQSMYNDIKIGINGLADALKVGAEHVYVILVRQQVVNSIADTVIILFLMVLLFTFAKPIYVWGIANTNKSDALSEVLAFAILAGTVVMLGIWMGDINNIVMGFVNPEYGALQEIMEWTKNANR